MLYSRTELSKRYNIDKNTWNRRHDELLEYLSEFMNIVEVLKNGRYYYEIINAPSEIPPIPRKTNKKNKDDDYRSYTIANLGTKFRPNSKAKVAKDAIDDFGYEKYGHTSVPAVVRRYVGPVMEEAGEHSDYMVWVDYNTYEIIDDSCKDDLMRFFAEERLTERDMANAFIKEQQGEDITEEKSGYKRAINKFKEVYGFIPIRVYEWKLKNEAM